MSVRHYLDFHTDTEYRYSQNDVPQCPYCNHSHCEWWDGFCRTDEEDQEVACNDCGKPFTVDAMQVIKFTSTPTTNEESTMRKAR